MQCNCSRCSLRRNERERKVTTEADPNRGNAANVQRGWRTKGCDRLYHLANHHSSNCCFESSITGLADATCGCHLWSDTCINSRKSVATWAARACNHRLVTYNNHMLLHHTTLSTSTTRWSRTTTTCCYTTRHSSTSITGWSRATTTASDSVT